ncbi:MAG TPA: substrate-binding domain-containing protein [Anaerolineaceae bacterium]|nr:substrate-binding domain-containing protein [Anaerolineaceae bacterium]
MLKQSHLTRLFAVLILAALLLSACAPATTTTPAPTEPPAAPTAPAAPTEEPTAIPATEVPTKAPTAAPTAPERTAGTLLMATTTSTEDSGLLGYLLPIFTQDTGIPIKYVAVGSGQALQLGKDGNVDVLLVHSPAAEKTFMDNKDGIRREDVMYNDFVIVGPTSDPAKISGMKSAVDAFKAIAAAQAPFVSRGDQSGTNTKELAIWKSAAIDPKGDWYINAGQGMGAVLTMSDEKQAYTLSDRATYLTQTKKGLTLKILVEGDKTLLNPYGVIAVNPDKSPKIQNDLANKFIDWLISAPVMEKVAAFGKADFGTSLFFPISKPYLAAHPDAKNPFAAPAGSGLKFSGKVATAQSWKDADLKAMPAVKATATNKDGTTTEYTGVSLKTLIELAKPAADAATLVFIGSDGYQAEAALKDVLACDGCAVGFNPAGGYILVMPGFPNKLAVKGLVEIQAK